MQIDGQGSVHVRAPVSTSGGGGGGDADGAATGASDAASPATGAGAASAGGLATPDIAALTDALLRSAFGTDASADAATSGSQGLGQEILRQASASSSAAAAAAAAGDADMEVDARNLAAAARVSAGAASKQGAPTPRGGNKQA
ncbi:hypothetical protein EON68_04905 [archaeon]|nr:MAG: hypothetical protein EON68_04905 [archaeon]